MDDDNKDVQRGGVGEIWLKGPCISKGYHNTPKVSKAAFHEGWCKTGDIGCVKDDLVFIVDRKKASPDLQVLNIS